MQMILDAINKYFEEKIYNVPHTRSVAKTKLPIHMTTVDNDVKTYVENIDATTNLNTFLRALSWMSADVSNDARKYQPKNYNYTWFKNDEGAWTIPSLPESIQKKLVWSTHGNMIDVVLNEFEQHQTLVDEDEEISVDYIHYPWIMKAAAYLYLFPIAIVDADDITNDDVKIISAMNSGTSIIVNLPSSDVLKVINLNGMQGIPDADNSRILTFEKTPVGVLKTTLSVENLSKRTYEKCIAKIDENVESAKQLFDTFHVQLSINA